MELLREKLKKRREADEKAQQEHGDNEQDDQKENKSEKWGYDMYPERRGIFKQDLLKTLTLKEGRETTEKMVCERNVYNCVMKSPLVKIMMGALKASGCPIDIRRHISCEVCDTVVTGGYDPEYNQIVVCQNSSSAGTVAGILTHEMIHMFDYCNNHIDFKNLEHLACTEIRAANLSHCSYLSAVTQGDASIFDVQKKHQDCVKSKALWSVMAARRVTIDEAISAIERVFPKCYADLEPIGRRIKRNSDDDFRAYREARLYGYV